MANLNLGCGNNILHGYVNLDVAALPGVDVVWDLEKYPWPFQDNQFNEIVAIDVLEHLSDKIKPIEELWRIAKPECKITIQVPNWNVEDMWVDPTHRLPYTHRSFDFFDVSHPKSIERGYLSKARFQISSKTFYVHLFGRTLRLKHPLLRAPIAWIGQYVSSVLRAILFELRVVK